jgi:hypothetical protein
VPSSTSACLLVTHSPNAAVLYSVRRIFSRSFNAIIVMQMVICHSHGWQQSALHVTDQPGPRHIAHVVVSTGPREHRDPSRRRSAQIKAYSACRRLHDARELTKTLPPTHNATAQPGSSWPRRREAFLPLARSYHMKGMPRASLHCRGCQGRHCREDCDGRTARRG